MLSAHLEQQIGESDTSFMMAAAAAKEVPDSSSNHSRDDISSGGDGSSSLSNHTVILGWNTKLVHRSPTNLWVFSCLLHSRSIFKFFFLSKFLNLKSAAVGRVLWNLSELAVFRYMYNFENPNVFGKGEKECVFGCVCWGGIIIINPSGFTG